MFYRGQRVKVMPHSDIWMMGERSGVVQTIGPKWITVVGDRSGRKFRFRLGGDSLEPA